MTLRKRSIRLVAAAIVLLTFSHARKVEAQGQPTSGASPRGIYVAGDQLGVSTEIEIERDGKRGMVPTTFEFKSGDRFWLHLTVNKDSYIYVLNRTVTGPGATSRGIKLLAEQDRTDKAPAADTYTLVFPASASGPQLVRKGASTVVPGKGLFFGMDDVPGAEKLMVLASETPLNLSSYFDPSTGRLLQGGGRADSVGTVLNRLNGELAQMADNTATDQPPSSRAISIVDAPVGATPPAKPKEAPALPAKPAVAPASAATTTTGRPPTPAAVPAPVPVLTTVAVPKQVGKPMLLELTLVHLAR